VYWNQILLNLLVQGVVAVIFSIAAWSRFTTKDVLA
jgi:hypothetical protein